MSQNVTGHAIHCGSSSLSCASRSFIFGETAPATERPARSPLMSAMNTGTPINENRSANTCSVTVLPVPVAPVISPCRLAKWGKSAIALSERAISNGSGMGLADWFNRDLNALALSVSQSKIHSFCLPGPAGDLQQQKQRKPQNQGAPNQANGTL